ncbi:MAG: efflux RND transporter permease subunit [Ignavibacteria bacterium]
MRFFKLFVNNRSVVYILMLMILIFGIISYASLPREAAPSVQIPYVFVSTVYVGVSPQDMENLVTQEIEKEVKGIKDVKTITSVSRESFSIVSIEFNPNVIIDDALQKVRDKVSTAKTKMPKDIKEPVISEFNISDFPILYINISGNMSLANLKDMAKKLSDKIEGVQGVLSADVVGGLEREVKINVDADRLKYYNLSLNDVINTISAENINIPGGGVDVGSSNYLIRVPGEVEDPGIIGDFVIKTDQKTNPVYIRDIGQVIYGYKDRTTYSRENGTESVSIVIKKRSGENLVRINDEIKGLVEKEKQSLPPGVKISLTGDQSRIVRNTVHELENGVITGMVLVILILLLFLGIKNALLTATSIPFSFLIAFAVLNMMGITLNIVVLFTLIVVLGIIVDDAIVVMENIYRLQDTEGYSSYDASIEGPREVIKPVSIATFTIISSFLPLLFFPGIVGEFMKYMPITLIVCLLSSLLVAMIISPVQASVFIHVQRDKEKGKKGPVSRFIEVFDTKFFNFMLKHYERGLRYSLRHRKLTIGSVVLLLIVMFAIYLKFNNGVEFFPNVEPKQANINITMPVGTNTDKTNEFTKEIEKKLTGYHDIEYYIANVGSSNNPLDFSGEGIPNKSTITLNFLDKIDRERSSFETLEIVRRSLENIAGGDIQIQKQSMGPPVGPPVNIEISGDDFEKLGSISNEIKRIIKDIPGMKDLKDNFDQARPEIKVTVDREKAALYKLNTSTIAFTIRTAINGTAASTFRVGEDEYDMTVRLAKDQRDNISSIENLYIANKDGVKIPLTSVANVDFSGGLGAIYRKDQKRVVTVSANAEGRLGNDVLKDVRAKLADYKLSSGYNIKYTGEQEDQKETSDFLGKAFLVSLLLIFLLMVIEFNSVSTPLIIMFSVLLSLIGVFAGLLLTRTPFGIVMTGVGVIALAGIVVRNAIVLLDFQKVLEERGMDRDEAMVKAGLIRLRPVFLTAAATIAGLVPLTTGIDFDWLDFRFVIGGENTSFWRPMGVAIIFGLTVSTFLTLVIVPAIFSAMDEVKIRFGLKKRAQVPVSAPAEA